MNTWQFAFQIAMAIAGSAVVTQGIRAIAERGKVDAEQVKIEAEANEVLSGNALEQLTSMKVDLAETKAIIREFRRSLYEHEKWDRMVLRELNSLGRVDIPSPPELWI